MKRNKRNINERKVEGKTLKDVIRKNGNDTTKE